MTAKHTLCHNNWKVWCSVESNIERDFFKIYIKNLKPTKLSKTFLLKSYFLRSPLPMLIVIYLFNVIVVGYIIFALERAYGTCMDYRDVIWMMGQGFKLLIHFRY